MHLKETYIVGVTLALGSALYAGPLGTGFTYQGRLTDGGPPANGFYDLRFGLFNANSGPSQVGPVLTNAYTVVSNGLFTVTLDFGANAFDGTARWVELGARAYGGGGDFTPFSPRLPLLASPYALYAPQAGVAAGVGANGVTTSSLQDGAVSAAKIGVGQVVKSFNGLFDNVTLSAGANIALTPLGSSTIQISSSGASSTAWGLTGNTLAATGNFLGTLNNLPLEIKVNNTRAFRLEPNAAGAPNVIGGSPYNQVATGAVGAMIGGGGAIFYEAASGGLTNSIFSDFGTIGGGYQNTIGSNNSPATIGGGGYNSIEVQASGATISGGSGNTNQFGAHSSSIAGGFSNTIQSNAVESVIGGGRGNLIQAGLFDSTIGGGLQNSIMPSASYATIAGGAGNQVSGSGAMIPGGMFNHAGGSLSFAAGNQAKANHTGAFVWADSTAADFASTGDNQFLVRATGGCFLSDNTPNLSFGTTARQMINLWGTTYGLGVQGYTEYFRCDGGTPGLNGFAWFQGGTHSDTRRDPGIGGVELMYLNNGGLTVNGTFVSTSDRNAKAGFEPVVARVMLEKVLGLPIERWHYLNDPGTAHIGPMAQDFYGSFRVGPDDKHITSVDAEGVALAAIQGLNQKLEEQRAELDARKSEIDDLRQRLSRFENLLSGPGHTQSR
jgi:hypothetical protein